MNTWILTNTKWNSKEQPHQAPIHTIGNGLFCCRAFFEEEQTGIGALGGIYMAGVFGRASYTPWSGQGRELVNVPNFYWMRIRINEKELFLSENTISDFNSSLDLQLGTLTRSYIYKEENEPLVKFEFFRFANHHNIYTAGQRLKVTPLKDDLHITVECGINTNVTNLNEVSCEPFPIQPGKKQFHDLLHTWDTAVVEIPAPDQILLAIQQKTTGFHTTKAPTSTSTIHTIQVAKGVTATIEKLVTIALSLEDGLDVAAVAKQRMADLPSFSDVFEAHKSSMLEFWQTSDIHILGDEEDQLTIRYNILQLMQSCPSHTSSYSIGARGLTGEMYEGSVFWDTEIFMLPFFSLTNPDAAKKLLEFRYRTLAEAKAHAQRNWFHGAMYGWQVNANGEEQTPVGVGAYYSIHVIADIAFAILDYVNCTGDEDFLIENGLEILIETARFWASRVTLRENGQYDIIAVRGPNEYGVIVNNNLYTNMMTRENFNLCLSTIEKFKIKYPTEMKHLEKKLELSSEELILWKQISENIVLPFLPEEDLWLEDDSYLHRKPLSMQKAKPTAKRIIDTTIPYEALPFYQVSKQADVLHLMKNLPWYFTESQIEKAYDYYYPRTAFDSSLSYSMFALMAARLGKIEEATKYFELSSKLDIKNVQLNTISGLHLANFGGTWQALVFGFCGITITATGVEMSPHLPDKWEQVQFNLCIHQVWLSFTVSKKEVSITRISREGSPISLLVCSSAYSLSKESETLTISL